MKGDESRYLVWGRAYDVFDLPNFFLKADKNMYQKTMETLHWRGLQKRCKGYQAKGNEKRQGEEGGS